MKLLLLILTISVYSIYSKKIPPSLVTSWSKLFEPFVEECIEESKVDGDIARNIFSTNYLPNEKSMHCYLRCIDEKLEFLHPEGGFNKELMLIKIDHLTPEIAVKCIDNFHDGENDCLKSRETSTAYDEVVITINYIHLFHLFQKGKIPPSVIISWSKLMEPFVEECIEESKIDADIGRNIFSLSKLPDEKTMHCYFRCLDKKMGFLLPDGKFNKELMLNKIDLLTPEIAVKCIDKFQNVENVCTKSYKALIPPSVVTSWNQLVGPFVEMCIDESKVDADIARNMFNRDYLPNEEHMRCYFHCINIKLGFNNPDGTFNRELMIKEINHLTPEIADKCLEKFLSEKEDCMRSYRTNLCIVEENLID
ncbi:hypothetical protein FQR65_LT12141 [Abscondita terminalis]|nr:hypothetical protein FQR65_LT12141 [Abscondita terminalis]